MLRIFASAERMHRALSHLQQQQQQQHDDSEHVHVGLRSGHIARLASTLIGFNVPLACQLHHPSYYLRQRQTHTHTHTRLVYIIIIIARDKDAHSSSSRLVCMAAPSFLPASCDVLQK